LHRTPSDDLLNTMSLAAQWGRKRQSSQVTKMLPAASTSAVGSGVVGRPPPTSWKRVLPIVTALVHEAPPSFDRKAAIVGLRLSKGTTTVPSGCTSGWPPRPLSWPAVSIGVLHVSPPSVDVLI